MWEAILLKRGWRSDRFWTAALVYKSPLRYVALFLDTCALKKSERWPRERMVAYQNARLDDLLAAARKIPLWRARIDAAGEGTPRERLSRMPVTAKKDLGRPLREIADLDLIGESERDQTSGSTGRPFHFFQDRGAILRSSAVTERTFRTVTRRYPIIYVRARPRHGFTFYRHVWFYIRGYTSIEHRHDAFARLASRFPRGFILYGYTSWIAKIARSLHARATTVPVRAVCVAGEHLSTNDREVIERAFRAPLFELYASREVGFLAYQCAEGRLHLNEEWACAEIVDETGALLPDGTQGRIVVTTFDNRVMPFIRYEIGDIGTIDPAVCHCGRTTRTLHFKGRASELIEAGDRTVALLDVAYAIGHHPRAIEQYQIVQRAPLTFLVRVIPGATFEEHKSDLELLLVRLLHPRAQIVWEIVDEIAPAQSGKAVYFVRDL